MLGFVLASILLSSILNQNYYAEAFVILPHSSPVKSTSRLFAEESKGEEVAAVGPRGESSSTSRPRSRSRRSASSPRTRTTSTTRQRPRRTTSTSSSPSPYPVATKRAPHQFDHTKDKARPFVADTLAEVRAQIPNEDAPPFVFPQDDNDNDENRIVIEHNHVKTKSLDDLFPGLEFSQTFSSDAEFRNALRNAMREDVFDTTPKYADMPEKARKVLLLPDTSLQGSWKCNGGKWVGADDNDNDDKQRMVTLTKVLKEYLGPTAPTGDEFMDTIGSLCGSSPQTHWIDIIGVQNRKIPHSWHQDTGRSPDGDTYTVLLGFPHDDNYEGTGVFSHVVKLKCERWAPEDHPPNEPVLYANDIDEKYIVRPRFAPGKEIIMYRDVDVLHSSPDFAYRTSVMRFM